MFSYKLMMKFLKISWLKIRRELECLIEKLGILFESIRDILRLIDLEKRE